MVGLTSDSPKPYFLMNIKSRNIYFFLLLIPILFWVFNVYAKQGFTIFPAKLSLTIDKGGEQENFIKVTNAGDSAVGVKIEVQDFVPTAGASGFNFVAKAPGITSLVDWIEIDRRVFNLKPNESRDIPFTVKVPSDASPGSRFAVVFFATGSSGGSQLNVSARVGALVFLTIPGDFKQTGEISNFRSPKFTYKKEAIKFDFDFTNTGTVFFEPKGLLTVTNIFGQKITEIPVEGYVVLPTGMRTISVDWRNDKWLYALFYKAHLAIAVTGKGDIATANTFIFAVPLVPTVFALIILAILFFITWYIKRNFKFAVIKKESEPAQNPKNKL